MISTGILFNFTQSLNPKITYAIACAYGLFAASMMMLFVSEPRVSEINTNAKKSIGSERTIKQKIVYTMKVAWMTTKTNPIISICLAAYVVVRM